MANNEEQLEVLNEKGEKTGEVVARSIAHRDGILHGASHTFIYKKGRDGKLYILLQRRSHNKDSFPDRLDISSAGHMSEGIDFRETAQKELQEELGVEVEDSELTEAFTQRFSKISEHHGEVFNNNEINKVYILKKDVEIEKIKLQEEEVSEVVWVEAETIAERLQAGDTEYCLDKAEFEKVLEVIKEREKMAENDFLKKMYEDLIISGRFDSSSVISALAGQTNEYGDSRQMDVILKGACATNILSALPQKGDKEVAKGIAVGVAIGKPIYGQIGQDFLMSKIQNYSQSSLGTALTKIILSELSGERIDKIISGVGNVLEGKEELSEEEKAADIANEIFDVTYKLSREQNLVRSKLVSQVIEKAAQSGTITKPYELEIKNINSQLAERSKQTYGQHESDLLNSTFDYYMSHQDEIPQKFYSQLSGHSIEEIIAYYVVSRGESDFERIQSYKKEGPTK